MRRARLLALPLLLVAMRTDAAPRMTVADYLALEWSYAEQGGSPVAAVYLMGALEALVHTNLVLAESGRSPLFCTPPGRLLVVDDVRQMLRTELAKMRAAPMMDGGEPPLYEVDISGATLAMLQRRYRCR